MKKLTVLLVALVAVFMVSCSKKGSDKVINLVNKTVEQLKQVKDAAGLEKVQTDFAAEYEKVLKEVDVTKFTEEEKAACDKAMEELDKLGEEVAAKFAPAEEEATEEEAAEGEEVAEEEAAPAEEAK